MLAPVRPTNQRKWRVPASLVLTVLVLAVVGVGCPCLRGPVNASPGLRWWLFSNFGADRICPEMLKNGMGLRAQDRGPAIGRFFPTGCSIDVNDETQTVVVNFIGTGYASMNLTGRVGFQCSASVEYGPDFYMGEDDLYVWGKMKRLVNGPKFELGYVENKLADVATQMTPLGTVANMFGNQITAGQLTQGFTVVENWDTESKSFALGVIRPPQKPHTPYDVSEDENHTYANETIEVAYNGRDYLGPFEVVNGDQRLLMKMFNQGPRVEVMVVDKKVGDMWREGYQQGRPLGPPPGPVLGGTVLEPNFESKVSFNLRPGFYYVVVDHTQYAGVVAPPPVSLLAPLSGPAARITYVAQLAEI
ncbi:MAG: hypothetical protein JRI68_13275 [Deltaproteobacteria bacterium]|nr:hypothetical protein [Deltaproteobacteria bacterium]